MAHRISNKEASRNMHRPNRSRAPRHLNNSMLEMEQLDSVKTFFFLRLRFGWKGSDGKWFILQGT